MPQHQPSWGLEEKAIIVSSELTPPIRSGWTDLLHHGSLDQIQLLPYSALHPSILIDKKHLNAQVHVIDVEIIVAAKRGIMTGVGY